MMAQHAARLVIVWTCVLCTIVAIGGCQSAGDKPTPGPTTPPSPTPSPASASENGATENATDRLFAESMPAIGDLRVSQEVLLHAALYRAAFASRVGEAGYVILDPVNETYPPNLGVEPDEFRSRVLAELQDLGLPVAWAPSTWRTQTVDVFPGTNEPATRLAATIIARDEEQATVTAEIGDRTPGSLSSRQTVTATWDGAEWRIEPGRARVVW